MHAITMSGLKPDNLCTDKQSGQFVLKANTCISAAKPLDSTRPVLYRHLSHSDRLTTCG